MTFLELVQKILDYVAALSSGFAFWIVDLAEHVFRWLTVELLNGVLLVLNALPDLGLREDFCASWAQVPVEIMNVLATLNFHYGVALILGAYTMRFLIRRIPLIG